MRSKNSSICRCQTKGIGEKIRQLQSQIDGAEEREFAARLRADPRIEAAAADLAGRARFVKVFRQGNRELATGLGVLGLSWQSSPALTELEEVTTDWLRQMVGLSDEWSGVIQDTASSCTLVALVCARGTFRGVRLLTVCAGALLGLHEGWGLARCLQTGVCVAAASLAPAGVLLAALNLWLAGLAMYVLGRALGAELRAG